MEKAVYHMKIRKKYKFSSTSPFFQILFILLNEAKYKNLLFNDRFWIQISVSTSYICSGILIWHNITVKNKSLLECFRTLKVLETTIYEIKLYIKKV